MDQVKGLCGQWIGDNVVALDLNRGLLKRIALQEKARVNVGDQDMAAGATALTKPRRALVGLLSGIGIITFFRALFPAKPSPD